MSVTVREKDSSTVLAQGEPGSDALSFEGNWYFAPESVAKDRLTVTERTYTCPYKGTCNWVDFTADDGRVVRDVAWVYPAPKPGYESIQGRYGFYAGRRGGTVQEG